MTKNVLETAVLVFLLLSGVALGRRIVVNWKKEGNA
jgi:hypothetical protein